MLESELFFGYTSIQFLIEVGWVENNELLIMNFTNYFSYILQQDLLNMSRKMELDTMAK